MLDTRTLSCPRPHHLHDDAVRNVGSTCQPCQVTMGYQNTSTSPFFGDRTEASQDKAYEMRVVLGIGIKDKVGTRLPVAPPQPPSA